MGAVSSESLVDMVIGLSHPLPDGATLESIETPAAVVDLPVMASNLLRTAGYCRENGLGYRPHTKTHKSPVLGTAQLRAGATGLTVATLREAEEMSAICDDLLLAYPQVGWAKLARLVELAGRVPRLTVALDSPQALAGLARAALESRTTTGVVIELDAGMGRVGVQTPAEAVALARAAAGAARLRYEGVMFYPGHIREAGWERDGRLAALQQRIDDFLGPLDLAGLKPGMVSGGSTPTLWGSHQLRRMTEIRPGTTVFNDRTTAEIGVCRWEECAYSILATVVSTSVPGQAVVDAGSKALSKEELRAAGGGYGALLDRPPVVVKSLSEEHGVLDLSATDWRPEVGQRVRIVPNHVCVSVNLQEMLWGVAGDRLVCRWPVAARPRSKSLPG